MIAVRLLVEGAIVREALFREDPVRLGRGTESDFVIADPTVSRVHARVVRGAGGGIWIEDAGSRNGLRVGGQPVARASLPEAGSLRCQLGGAELDLARWSAADATLELVARPEAPRALPWAPTALAHWAAGVGAISCGLVLQPSFWSPWEQDRLSSLTSTAMRGAVGLPVLAFLLFGVLRVVRRRIGLADTFRALALLAWAWFIGALLVRAASYALSVGAHGRLTALVAGCGTALTFAYLASLGRRGPQRRFFLAWLAVTALLIAGGDAAARLAARQAGAPQLDYDLEAPIAGWAGPASDLDSLMDGLQSDFSQAERRAAEDRRDADSARR